MKQIFIAASLALMVASCANESNQPTTAVVSVDSTVTLAYVNMERILSESDLFQSEGMPIRQRTEAAQRDWAQKEQKLQSDAAQLQKKYQDGLITTANAQLEQKKIEERIAAFQTATQKQAAEIDEENTVYANRAQKLLRDAISNINSDRRYSMILESSMLIDADSTLDISTTVLAEFNRLYKAEK